MAVVALLPQREVIGVAQGFADLLGQPQQVRLEREATGEVRVVLVVGVYLPLVLAGGGVPLGAVLQVAAGVVDPRQGGVVLRPAPELRRGCVGHFFPGSWLGPAAGRRIVGIDAGPLAQVELVDVGFIEARKEVLVGTLLQELHLD